MTDDAVETDRDAEEFGLVEHLDECRQLEESLDTCEAALAETREQLDALQVSSQVLEDTVSSWTKSAGDKRKRSLASEIVREKRLRESYTDRLDPKTEDGVAEMLASNPEAGEAEQLAANIDSLEAERETLQRQLMQHNVFLKEACIQARNTLTRSAIQRDFVHAAKE